MQPLKRRGWAAMPPTRASTLLMLAGTLAALVAGTVGPATATAAGGSTVVQPTQALAILRDSHTTMSAPNAHSAEVQQVSARRPITGERTVLPVVGQRTGADGVDWLHVLLPGRPNGHTGWIRQRATVAWTTSWHIVIHTATRRVTVYRDGRSLRTFRAVVGKASTPTPHGQFFVEEDVQLRPGDAGAPFALALSARSDVLQEFDGGPGQIALHGLANIGGVLGSAVSHGCVRLANDAMRWLVVRIGPGVPVTISS